jgi:hypothetical protein
VRRFSVILVIASMGFAGVALSATSAGATAPTVSGVCKTLTNVHITPSNDPTANGGRANALKLSKVLSKAAKKSKGDIKKTLTTLSNYFKALGTGDTATVENDAESFAAAATSYASYLASNCLGSSLPKGVTIPKLPST